MGGGPDAWPMRDHVQRWIEEENFGPEETRVLATHNLAVFFHLIAVEIETKLCEEGVEELAREGLRDDAPGQVRRAVTTLGQSFAVASCSRHH